MDREILKNLEQLSLERKVYALASVIEVIGSSSAPIGSRAIFDAEGRLLAGWVGGGCAQSMIAHTVVESFLDHRSRIVDVDLTDEVFGAGMPCGGHMRVFVEPCHPRPLLWLLGRGALVEYLCRLATEMGFDVILQDAGAKKEPYPDAIRVIDDDDRYERISPAAGDFVVIATHHQGDLLALRSLLGLNAAYIGVIASRHRSRLIVERLRAEGFSEAQISRISAPAGLQLGSVSYREIALSIIAQLIAIRRNGSAVKSPNNP